MLACMLLLKNAWLSLTTQCAGPAAWSTSPKPTPAADWDPAGLPAAAAGEQHALPTITGLDAAAAARRTAAQSH
jgi:hypothetical protein